MAISIHGRIPIRVCIRRSGDLDCTAPLNPNGEYMEIMLSEQSIDQVLHQLLSLSKLQTGDDVISTMEAYGWRRNKPERNVGEFIRIEYIGVDRIMGVGVIDRGSRMCVEIAVYVYVKVPNYDDEMRDYEYIKSEARRLWRLVVVALEGAVDSPKLCVDGDSSKTNEPHAVSEASWGLSEKVSLTVCVEIHDKETPIFVCIYLRWRQEGNQDQKAGSEDATDSVAKSP